MKNWVLKMSMACNSNEDGWMLNVEFKMEFELKYMLLFECDKVKLKYELKWRCNWECWKSLFMVYLECESMIEIEIGKNV